MLEEPDEAAVEAARAREAQFASAFLVLLDCELEHPDCRTVRSLRDCPMAFATTAAAAPSTSIFRTLVLKVSASLVRSVVEPSAKGIAPSAEKEYVPVWKSWTAAELTVGFVRKLKRQFRDKDYWWC